MKVMVTGGAGFIGANFLNLLVPRFPEHQFVNVDKLTYAANLASLREVEGLSNYITSNNAWSSLKDAMSL